MGKRMLAGVFGCALASQAFGAAYLFEGGRYEQNFEGLQWQASTTARAYDFGAAESGTLGWASGTGTTNDAQYRFRQSSTEALSNNTCGSPFIPGGGVAPADKSFTRTVTTGASYTSVYLINDTGATIDNATVGYTVEAWLHPTANLASGVVGRFYSAIGTNSTGATVSNPSFAPKTQLETFVFTTADPAGAEIYRSQTLANLGWDSGETLALTWYLPLGVTTGHMYGLDDVFVAVPEPSVVMMAIGVGVAALGLRRRAVA